MKGQNSLDRIKKELSEVRKSENLESICASAGPIKRGDLYHWKACFIGPKDTGYDGGLFRLLIDFPTNYPQEKPDVNFKYPVFHPNINCSNFDINKPEGKYHICIEILHNWKPEYDIVSVILSIYQLLVYPNPSNGYMNEATKLLKEGKNNEFKSKCNEWVRKYSTIYNK